MITSGKKILLLVYALSPSRGSEYAVAWNYITEMSKDNNLTVLYGTTGDHLGEIDPPDEHQALFPHGNVHLVPVYSNRLICWVNSLNRKGVFVYSFYFAYNLWHRQVFRVARELIRRQHFDLIHYLGPIGYREPGYLWKLNLPYIWGPIGGMDDIAPTLLKSLPSVGKIKLGMRTILNKLQLSFSWRVHRAIRHADVLLASTTETRNIIQQRFGVDAIYLPENAIKGTINLPNPEKFNQAQIHLIWIGRIDANKSLGTVLDAVGLMKHRAVIRLHIVGDGPLEGAMRRKVGELGLGESIIWHGKVERKQVFELLKKAHLHIISSCIEANTTVIFEAMANSVPTISLDHCGMHDTICEQCGIKIPVIDYRQVVADFAEEFDKITQAPERLQTLAAGTTQCARKYTWGLRREFLNRIYDVAISHFERTNYPVKSPDENV
ncbi:MAG: glycosyltransferase [Victivallales bacterium]|jgi:glycosyltransferase involved in cell wall biosynthesis